MRGNVADLRERLGLSQAAFANLVGVSVETVRRWERGEELRGHGAIVCVALAAHIETPVIVDLLQTSAELGGLGPLLGSLLTTFAVHQRGNLEAVKSD